MMMTMWSRQLPLQKHRLHSVGFAKDQGQVAMSIIPAGEVQPNSVARQVFPEATPTMNVSESEAKAVEDIPAASAKEN